MPALRKLLIGVAVILVSAQASAAAGAHPDRHELTLQLRPETNQLLGRDRIIFDAPILRDLDLSLASQAEIRSVTVEGAPVDYLRRGGSLKIKVPSGSSFEAITVTYAATFTDSPPRQPAHHEDPGFGVAATLQPQGTYLSGGTAWYPRRPGVAARLEVAVSGPPGYHAVTAGKRTQFRSDLSSATSTWTIEHAVEGLALAAGPYRVFGTTAGEIPVYAYFHADSAQLADLYLQAASRYLELYQQLFGDYPFAKFAVVENFFPTGYGFPSWTLLGSSVIQLPFIVRTSLGHEIAHSWWGTAVKVDYSEGNWSEGLTTYVADYLFKERESPEAARDYRLKILRDYATLKDETDFPPAAFTSRHDKLSQAVGYGKVAMLFHMIRQRVGDQAFWSALRQVAAKFRFERAAWSDLLAAFGAQSGTAVEPFIRPWLERSGAPKLALEDVKVVQDGRSWMVRGVLVQELETFPLQVPFALETESGMVRQQIFAGRPRTPFTLTTATRPKTLEVDPDADIFRLLTVEEIPASVNHLRASDRLVAVVAPDARQSRDALNTLLAGLRRTAAATLDLEDYRKRRPDSADLLFFGTPTADDLPAVAAPWPATAPASAGNALLVLRRQKHNPERIVAIYAPGSGSAATRVAQKIPHYGKYGWLEFADGTIVHKEILAPAAEPLRIDLSQRRSHQE